MQLELPFTWQAILTIGVLLGIVVALARELARPDLVFFTGLAILLVTGVLAPEDAFAGFANNAIWIVGSLYVVAAGVQQTDLLSSIDRILFSRFDSPAAGIIRLSVATASLSSVVNNTPVVAMLIPRVQEWARSRGVCPSRLLLPLSYAAIVGGMLTLVGTSTNIVVFGLLTASGGSPLRMFAITWVGLPVAAAVILYMPLVGYRFLPTRDMDLESPSEGIRDYVFGTHHQQRRGGHHADNRTCRRHSAGASASGHRGNGSDRRLRQLRHTNRLSDQLDGHGSRTIPFRRLCPSGISHSSHQHDGGGDFDLPRVGPLITPTTVRRNQRQRQHQKQ
jgi:hypothetical protein